MIWRTRIGRSRSVLWLGRRPHAEEAVQRICSGPLEFPPHLSQEPGVGGGEGRVGCEGGVIFLDSLWQTLTRPYPPNVTEIHTIEANRVFHMQNSTKPLSSCLCPSTAVIRCRVSGQEMEEGVSSPARADAMHCVHCMYLRGTPLSAISRSLPFFHFSSRRPGDDELQR